MLELYANIKRYRKAAKMTQEELARMAGYTDRSSIAKIEKGQFDLSQSKIKQFADIFGVTPGQLMGWDSDPAEAGALAAMVIKDPEAFQFMRDFMKLDEVDRYALRLVLESMKIKKEKKKTDAVASVVEVE